jgi:YVTN family beta-propeller protein
MSHKIFSPTNIFRFLIMCLAVFLPVQQNYAQDNSGYHVIRSIKIGGKGGWDYIAINKEMNRIYVSHDTLVYILNESTGDSIGVIPNTRGVHGIAFAAPFGKGYTSNGKANTATVFDLKTNQTIKEIKTGENPDAIVFDAFSKTIFICNGRSKDATVIDPSSDTVITTIALDGKPEAPVSDGAGNIYVNIEDRNEVAHINTKTWKVEHRWSIAPAEGPTGIAMDKVTKRLFVGCDKLMVVLDSETGKVIAQLPIGDRCDGVVFDAQLGYIFTSNGEGTLTMVQEVTADSFRVVATIPTKRGARTLALDEQTHHIFLPTAEFEAAPPATPENPRPRPKIVPGTFQVLEVGK